MLLAPLLALLSAAPAAAPAPPAAPLAPFARAEDYAALVAAYDAAAAAWQETFDAAPLAERRAVREKHPAREFWPRFEAAADGGEGRALLWMAAHLREKGLKRGEAEDAKRALYRRLFAEHLDAPWLTDAVAIVAAEADALGQDLARELLTAAAEKAADPTVQLLARLKRAELAKASDDPERKAEAERFLEEYEQRHLAVGVEALDFHARTVDGHPFKLSDYRGKAVLVDFYGFW